MKNIAVYPGSFDPITNGHLDIIDRALKIFDEVIILIAVNPDKKCTFDLEERIKMIQDCYPEDKRLRVESTSGLTVHYAHKIGARTLIRGLRAATDFEYEFQINSANRYIDHEIETIFLMARSEFMFIASSTIKQMVKGGVDVSKLVPESVNKRLKKLV